MKLTLEQCKRYMDANDGNFFLLDFVGMDDYEYTIELPDNLTVLGCMELTGVPIKKLPKNLVVHGYLDIRGTDITEIPADTIVKGAVFASESKLMNLPANWTVQDLYIDETPIEKLPSGLTIICDLHISDYPLVGVPEDTVVGGTIYVSIMSDEKKVQLDNDTFAFVNEQDAFTYTAFDGTEFKFRNEWFMYIGKVWNRYVEIDGLNFTHPFFDFGNFDGPSKFTKYNSLRTAIAHIVEYEQKFDKNVNEHIVLHKIANSIQS